MRILLLTQVVPYPPDSGPKIKTYNVLRYLAEQHELHLVSFVRAEAEQAAAQELRRYCRGVTTVPLRRSRERDLMYLGKSILTGRPFLVERDDHRAMRRAIDQLIKGTPFDAVHADQLSMGQFAVDLPLPLRVLDEHNAVWEIVRRATAQEPWGVRRVLAEMEWRKLRTYEGDLGRQFDHVTVVSEADRQALVAAAQVPLRTTTIPIAVDTHETRYVPRTPHARDISSVATMFYPPNVDGILWFSSTVFPLVREAMPDRRFYIVGSRPPRNVRVLAEEQPGIVVTGYVADLEPILARTGVLVVPVRSGSGMRVKILEAFARGIPVVSTTVGVEGIAARAGHHLLVADDPAPFAEAVVRLLREPGFANELAAHARELVEREYDWRAALAGLNQVYQTNKASNHAERVPLRDPVGA
jgi:sugar transferase (PEP-CTERM/EpsH1 system associated)